jgi:hypothetical protein
VNAVAALNGQQLPLLYPSFEFHPGHLLGHALGESARLHTYQQYQKPIKVL